MKKKLIVLMLSMSMTAALVSGCGSTAETAVESTATETVQETATEAETADAESDQEAADKVAALIDQIYVQERNDNTDEQCAEAKAAWDALTDAQKELVEGENADPDYFGRDTGDASKDDPLNADEIGENELLVVSFGTSFNDSRTEDIGGIEKMSKSKNNGIDPQTQIEQYGADTARLFTMFASPPEQTLEWSGSGVEGASRFLRRVWAFAFRSREIIEKAVNQPLPEKLPESLKTLRREIHQVLQQANQDYARIQYNTVVSACKC